MPYNINAGLGKLLAESVFAHRPHTGKTFLVIGSSHANYPEWTEMLPGTHPDGPVTVHTTLQGAIDAAASNQNDVIYIANGHTETITAAGGITVNKTGLTIIGLGEGNDRPTIAFSTATSADLEIDNANCTFENIIFDLTGIDALTGPIDVDAASCRFIGCKFITADSDGQCAVGIVTDANADQLLIKNCEFLGSVDAGTTSAIRIVGGDEIRIEDNYFEGAYKTTAGAIQATTTGPAFLLVKGNVIRNLTASSSRALDFVHTSRVLVENNRFHVRTGATPVSFGETASTTLTGWIGTAGNYFTNLTRVMTGALL